MMMSRGCGRYGSYAQTYYLETEATSEGVSCSKNAKRANKDFHELLVKSKRIVERTKDVKNRYDEIGERIILEFDDEKSGKSVEICWFDGGKCFYFIKATTLELALEFEKWQKTQK